MPIYMNFDGVEGESFRVLSFSGGVQVPGNSNSKGRPTDFTFVKPVDKSSPQLMLACANGQHIKKAVLTVRKGGEEEQDFFKVQLEDVLISSYQVGATEGGEDIPMETLSLNFAKILVGL